jgi:hypothetical protein
MIACHIYFSLPHHTDTEIPLKFLHCWINLRENRRGNQELGKKHRTMKNNEQHQSQKTIKMSNMDSVVNSTYIFTFSRDNDCLSHLFFFTPSPTRRLPELTRWGTRRVSYEKHELITLREHLGSSPVVVGYIIEVHVSKQYHLCISKHLK